LLLLLLLLLELQGGLFLGQGRECELAGGQGLVDVLVLPPGHVEVV